MMIAGLTQPTNRNGQIIVSTSEQQLSIEKLYARFCFLRLLKGKQWSLSLYSLDPASIDVSVIISNLSDPFMN